MFNIAPIKQIIKKNAKKYLGDNDDKKYCKAHNPSITQANTEVLHIVFVV